ncbi:MAG TPA: hypothetical protein VKD90_17595 [Gemmataceae bacterium]|nr:hypothetical protein [Gemmataceae bacterium]
MAARGRRNADDAIAVALAAGQTQAGAAAAAGVSERTVARRVTDPAFRQLVSRLRGEMVGQAIGVLVAGMFGSAVVLRHLMLNAESETVRLGAARSVLELALRAREATELEERVQALEEGAAKREGN